MEGVFVVGCFVKRVQVERELDVASVAKKALESGSGVEDITFIGTSSPFPAVMGE